MGLDPIRSQTLGPRGNALKRDMELIRKILFFLEARPFLKAEKVLPIEGYDEATIMYHMLLLAQAGLVDFEPEFTKSGRIIKAHVLGLNWAGHEFLDSVRSDKVWRKLLKYAKDKGGALPFDLLKALAVELLKKSIE
jgi:DNA-binding transcriptional ArsR family regulator